MVWARTSAVDRLLAWSMRCNAWTAAAGDCAGGHALSARARSARPRKRSHASTLDAIPARRGRGGEEAASQVCTAPTAIVPGPGVVGAPAARCTRAWHPGAEAKAQTPSAS